MLQVVAFYFGRCQWIFWLIIKLTLRIWRAFHPIYAVTPQSTLTLAQCRQIEQETQEQARCVQDGLRRENGD